jgi:putative component of membrane protein insertase Oxa1/YidC/SpoIIIJ protein YidD
MKRAWSLAILAGAVAASASASGCASVRWSSPRWAGAEDPEWNPGASDAETRRLREDTRLEVEEAVGGMLVGAVRLYQGVLRPAFSSGCGFEPSCSNYMIHAIAEEGPFVGMLMGVDRIFRDHLFSASGYPRDGARLVDPPRYRADSPARWTPLQDPLVPPKLAERAAEVRDRLATAPEDERTLFSFAAALLTAGDRDRLFRAGTEFRRFASYHPRSPLRGDAVLLAGVASLLADRFREAGETLALLLRGYASFRRRDFPAAQADFRALESDFPGWRTEARVSLLLAALVIRRDEEALRILRDLENDEPSDRWAPLRSRIEVRPRVPSRSPTAAGLLSAVLPGAGQAYAGRPADGLVSLLLTGAFVWTSVEAFDENLEAAGAITGAVGLLFYASGILGATKAAHAFNDAAQRDWFDGFARDARGPETFWTLDSPDPRSWPRFGP